MTVDRARAPRRPRACPSRAARLAAWTLAASVVAASAAACSASSPGSAGSPNPAVSTGSQSAVAYSSCIRSHGVPNFGDPGSNGQVPKADAQALGVSSSQLQAAQRSCRHLFPSGGGSGGVLTRNSLGQCEETGYCPQAVVQAAMDALRIYARCMRSHGLPTWPDPSIGTEGRPGFNLLHVQGFDPNSAQTSNVMQECYHVMPGGVPIPVIAPGGPG